MLVLARKKNEEIIFSGPDGTRIIVKLTDIRGDSVRLGLMAPPNWTIHRREVQDAIDREAAANKIQLTEDDIQELGTK